MTCDQIEAQCKVNRDPCARASQATPRLFMSSPLNPMPRTTDAWMLQMVRKRSPSRQHGRLLEDIIRRSRAYHRNIFAPLGSERSLRAVATASDNPVDCRSARSGEDDGGNTDAALRVHGPQLRRQLVETTFGGADCRDTTRGQQRNLCLHLWSVQGFISSRTTPTRDYRCPAP